MKKAAFVSLSFIATVFLLSYSVAVAEESAQLREARNRAAQGDAAAMTDIGGAYFAGTDGLKQDRAEGIKWFKKGAAGGNVHAMNNLGIVYRDGVSVVRDPVEAHAWFMKAAEAGHTGAQFSVSDNYRSGTGVERDLDEAEKWAGKAAEREYLPAIRMLGVIALTRYQSTKNEEQARRAAKWMRKAADRGDATAQYNLGLLYRQGSGVQQDEAEAVRWLRKAADAGDDYAQLALGRSYLRGRGVEQDYGEARRWLETALKSKDPSVQGAAKEELAKIPTKRVSP